MTKSILKLSLLSLLAIAVGGLVVQARAQETDKPTVEKKESKKSGVTPFHGKLKAVDTTAKTITVGELTIQITSDTKISKAGKPATLEDGVVGEDVSGAYRKTADGKLDATTVHLGHRPEKGDLKKEHRKGER
jgi:hypothetical protein